MCVCVCVCERERERESIVAGPPSLDSQLSCCHLTLDEDSATTLEKENNNFSAKFRPMIICHSFHSSLLLLNIKSLLLSVVAVDRSYCCFVVVAVVLLLLLLLFSSQLECLCVTIGLCCSIVIRS